MGVAVPTLVLNGFTWGTCNTNTREEYLRLPEINISVKNYGQSPAFVTEYNVEFTCEALPEKPIFKKYPDSFGSEYVIDAGEIFSLSDGRINPGRLLPEEDLQALIDSKKSLTVYGYVRYGDVFGSPDKFLRFSKRLCELPTFRHDAVFISWGGKEYTGQEDQNPN